MKNRLYESCADIDMAARDLALERQANLTKPPGSLGLLESIAVQFAGCQGNVKPNLEQVIIAVFAADHGIADEGVSAFPQAVTVEMIKNFANGGAAISVLAKQNNADLYVVNMGTASSCEGLSGVLDRVVAAGTQSFSSAAAMTEGQCLQAISVGRELVEKIMPSGAQLFIGGEMGIANTSSATALGCMLMGLSARELTGAGTGLDQAGIQHKMDVIDKALAFHGNISDPLDVLQRVGGFEIAALVGAYITAAQKGVPSLVDGFISTSAALVACVINPGLIPWLLFSHQSAEQGHKLMLQHLQVKPLLQLDMRLGEGSGAAVCLPIIQSALQLHNNMATFDEAAVSGKLS